MVDVATAPHIVLAATPVWSHFRALCILSARLAAERPIVVTVVVPNHSKIFNLVSAETERFLRDIASPRGILRVVGLGAHSTVKDPAEMFGVGMDALPSFWEALTEGSDITCSVTQKTYASGAHPQVAVLDMFLYGWHPTIRRLLPQLPLLWYNSGTASGITYVCLPGGRYPDDAHFTREGDAEVPPQFTGRVLHVAGLPPMYDWEFVPQKTPFQSLKFEAMIARSLHASDGIMSCTAVGFDGEEAIAALSRWAADRGRPAFHVGPLLPFKEGTTEFSQAALDAEKASAPPGVADTIQAFLDHHYTTKGAHSVVYVCFGTHFWPENNPDHLWALLAALRGRGIPFILSHPSPFAQVPDSIKEQYQDASHGLLVPWSPQQAVLAHKAIGWFVTHGGAGGTMDALTQGVPVIGWPAFGDQPSNIAYLTHVADVAFELVEVRTGALGLKPLLPSGKTPTGTLEAFQEELKSVLDDMAGPVGQRKRNNAKKHQAELGKAWSEGGPARVEFNNFVAHYGL